MLQHLYISNFALIERLEIDFESGFSVITGETGAGKSIMLGAINFLLGARADAKQVKQGSDRCVIEAIFRLSDIPSLQEVFIDNDLEYDAEECILRRELTAAGKSRAFVNDTPVTLTLMRELGDRLIDIHSQHHNLFLNKRSYQLYVLDTLSDADLLVHAYADLWNEYKVISAQLTVQREVLEKARTAEDYLSFQLAQIDEANFKEEEEETLKEEIELLSNAEEIQETLGRAYALLQDDEAGILPRLTELNRLLQRLQTIKEWNEKQQRVEENHIDLSDVAADIEAGIERVEHNPMRLAELTARLDLLYSLEQKHHVASLRELLCLADEFREQLSAISLNADEIDRLERQQQALMQAIIKQGTKLTKARQIGAEQIAGQVETELRALGIPHACFKVEITPLVQPDRTGMDNVSFLFSANKGGMVNPIEQVASGGEMARIMLVLKSLLATVSSMPTIIFDEIDTGVSGEIADRMTQMMRKMGATMQVVSITHLPQMAAGGNVHYYVYKTEEEKETNSQIRRLSASERVTEIAHMISGATLTPAALTHAEELLKSNSK